MKFLLLGLCLLCTVVVSIGVLRAVQQHRDVTDQRSQGTDTTQTGAVSSFTVWPKTLPRSPFASETALPAGTVVSVTLADAIDSDHDRFGKQYAASVETIEGWPIVPRSRATVVLLNNNTGWHTQLTGLTVKGRSFRVFSGAGSLVSTDQDSQSSSPPWILERVGRAPTAPGTNDRVRLSPATQLRFVLIRNTTGAGEVAPYESAARMGMEPGFLHADAESQRQPEVAYLCRANDMPEGALPIYYIADIFKTSDNPSLVESRWHQFLVSTYPYRFANNAHATTRCSRLTDPTGDLKAGERLAGELKSENAEVVQTRWHYTIGPPPAPAPWSAASTLP